MNRPVREDILTYAESIDFLFNLPSWQRDGAYHPGLSRVEALLDSVGNPHEAYPIVHVAGTNGKGSVSAMIASALTAGGNRTGLHTSPHLFSFAERMRVDGADAPEDWIAAATGRMAPTIESVRASFFEASTAMSLLYFAEAQVDVAVVEVGLGGRLDATNVVTPVVSAIVSIGLDHTRQLGETLAEIAAEKAGIIKTGVPVVSGVCEPEPREVIRTVSRSAGSRLVETCEHPYPDRELDLVGDHQQQNARVALAALDLLMGMDRLRPPDAVAGLKATRSLAGLRARCQVIGDNPLVVVDVAHNAEGIEASVRCARRMLGPGRRLTVLMSLSVDRDVGPIAEVLSRHPLDVIVADTRHPRLREAHELAAELKSRPLRILEIADPAEAVLRFCETSGAEGGLLATGSHFLAGALPRAWLDSGRLV